MLKNGLLVGLVFMIGLFAACEKPEVYNAARHFEMEEANIMLWSDTTEIPLQKHESGVYYHIDTLGNGGAIELTDSLSVEYSCKLLRDTVLSEVKEGSVYKFVLNSSIPGWKAGLPLIREGGQIRLLVPSPLAYRDRIVNGVPANSTLNFLVRIRKVVKKK
ncbi:MAG: FKBP-type peptidyl-prolyl cis-trans isomerase [Bacteroidota bacterium]